MANAKTQLILSDAEIQSAQAYIEEQSLNLEQMHGEYIAALQKIQSYGLKSGSAAKALNQFIILADQLKTVIETTGTLAETTITNYIAEVDKADSYVY